MEFTSEHVRLQTAIIESSIRFAEKRFVESSAQTFVSRQNLKNHVPFGIRCESNFVRTAESHLAVSSNKDFD